MTDWALIAGGRCQGEPWRVGIAGIGLGEEEGPFLLSNADWELVSRLLPFAELQAYGDANGLQFEWASSLPAVEYDGILLVELGGSRAFPLLLQQDVRRYLLLLEQRELPEHIHDAYSRIFSPADVAFLGQHLIRLNQPLGLPLTQLDPRPAFKKTTRIYGRDNVTVQQAHFSLCDAESEVTGWLSPQWQACLLAGAVPVHTAATPIPEWFPRDCYVDGSAFANSAELLVFLDAMPWAAYQALEGRFRAFLMQGGDRPDERIYPYTTDFWINALTSTIALDASEVRGDAPVLSVVVTAFNYGRYLGQTVRSVLDQGIESLEVLVLDNASTDETPAVMASFASESRVRYMRNRRNFGAGNNGHNGAWVAKGKYLVVFMADDYMNPGHMARLLPVMENNPQVSVGYSPIRWVNEQGEELNGPKHPGHRQVDYIGGRNEVADLLVYDNYITPSAAIIRREAFFNSWQRDVRIRGSGDWQLMVQLAERFPDFVFTTMPGVSYRVHAAQHSNEFYGSTAPLEGHLCILEGVFERGNQGRLKGREREVAEHLRQRLAGYPQEQESTLGERVRRACGRLEILARECEQALFSIILTTYNRPDLLKDALASVSGQTLRDFEVILVNDNGDSVESSLAACDFPVTYIRQGRNLGLSAARNAGLKLARGRYIVYLDDDDIYLPDHLAVLAEVFENHPESVAYTGVEYINERLEDGQRIELSREMPFRHTVFDRDRLFTQNYIPVNTWGHPRSMLAEVGEFDTGLTAFEDWDMLLRLAARYPFIHVSQVTAEVHLRDSPNTGSDHMLGREQKNFGALYQEMYRRHSDLDREVVRAGRREVLRRFGISESSPSHRSPSMQEWLSRRSLTPMQKQLAEDRLQQHGQGPSFGVLLLDLQGGRAKLATTLGSLRQPYNSYKNIQPVVLTTGEAPVPGFDGQVVVVGADNWLSQLNPLLTSAAFDWFVLVNAGDEFTPNGLLMAGLELLGNPDCRAVYCDEMYRQADGALGAAFRPDFNLDYLLSFPAGMAKHWLFRRDVLIDAGGFDSAYKDALEFELILRLINRYGLAGLGHITEPLLITDPPAMVDIADEQRAIALHLEARGYQEAIVGSSRPGRYRIGYGHPGQPLVSILIACGEQLPRLQRCVESLLETTRYPNYELLLIDSHPEAQTVGEWLGALEGLGEARLRVVRPALKACTLALTLNQAAEHAVGDYLLLLSAGTAIIGADWLDGLINHAQRPEVGVVGAKLLSAEGKVRQAGLLLGLSGPVGRSFVGEPLDAAGYMQRLQVDQNYSAVSLDCLMIGRELYRSLGGLDERGIPACYADADLCLKVQEAGYLTVWAADVQLMQAGDEPPAASLAEQDAMYAKWLPLLARDPAYNSNLSLVEPGGFKLADNKLSWRPLNAWRPLPTVLAHPADRDGCGQYRVIQPFNALQQEGFIDGALSFGMLSVADLERYDPDVVLLQRQIGDERLEAMRRMQAFSRAFKVYELDDYLPNLPMKSAYRAQMPRDILRSLRLGISYVDRFVVSTDAMAEAFQDFHPDIRVMENRLDPRQWHGLTSRRRCSSKPRVGWAGGAGHTGDLEMLTDVVKELASEVEWVFFGMCPDKLKPFIHELHPGVPIEQYPAVLAGLNLDLALAPVEQNLFNECKSNLRLLEYGACGYPVICSDVRCYRDALPVTRVKNRFKDWLDAIRLHLSDLDAAAGMGDELRAVVNREWMLEGPNLESWRKVWLPN